ncbi:hypothetical protein [Aurantivibrio plasticivorans]
MTFNTSVVIHVHLAGRIKKIDIKENDFNLFFRLPHIRSLDEYDWLEIDLHGMVDDHLILHSLIKSLQGKVYSRKLVPYLNHWYKYSLRPYVSFLNYIGALEREYPDAKFIFYTEKSNSYLLPLFGFPTTESPRGNENLLGARFGALLQRSGIKKNYSFIYSGCVSDIKRWLVLKSIFTVSAFILIAETVLMSFSELTECKGKRYAVIIRSLRQYTIAKQLCGKDFCFVVVPQFGLPGLRLVATVFKECFSVKGVGAVFSKVSLTVREFVRLWRGIARLKKIESTFNLFDDWGQVDVDISAIANEVALFPLALMYQAVLLSHLNRRKFTKIVNFEMKGPYAGVDSLLCRELKFPLVTVQTTNVPAKPLPVFPLCDYFCADNSIAAENINNIGALSLGAVGYEGPFMISNNEFHSHMNSRKVVFFTQPYEIEVTLTIINELLKYCEKNNMRLEVNLHPRDVVNIYADKFPARRGFLLYSKDSVEKSFEGCMFAVTKTSSVIKECIYYNLPIIFCTFSEYDKTIHFDFLKVREEKSVNHCCCLSELRYALENVSKVRHATSRQREEIFLDKNQEDLKRFIS